MKYRISLFEYRKPGFWICLLAVISFVFVCVCLMTSPKTVVEVPVDADVPLREISQEDPAKFTPAVLPEMEPNPDWGVDVIMDVTSPIGGKMVYVVEERFAAASETITMKDSILEKWNGSAWESVPSRSGRPGFEDFQIGSPRPGIERWSKMPEEADWELNYGPFLRRLPDLSNH